MEDEKIIELYWGRDREAISETDKKYGSYCMTVANNILHSTRDAEECVNDTYFKTWNSIPPTRPKILSAFLGKITRNLAFNRYRMENAEKRGGGELPLILDELAELVSGEDDVESAVELSELKNTLNAFLKGLSQDKRSIFLRRYWYCDSVKEIAERYAMSEAAVSMNLVRLRKRLRGFLMERGFEV
ncbi:MAG: sigma-70 family RNA polymerase sigma factor [Oscillospiraceae bacterium]|nr:sigma-70 family RNA polymerase sigma factor [Oscillospiraceae bacterium]